jgi:ATP-dependent DNA helicase DinG
LRPSHRRAGSTVCGIALNSLSSRVRAALGDDGVAGSLDNVRPRAGQLAMALGVARAIEGDERLVVEAGTGLGKTYAYLVPVLLSGRRALISTATQALQDQLFARDIPAVSRGLGIPVRVAVLKGRSNYVCLHRLEQAVDGGQHSMRDPAMVSGLNNVLAWARRSSSGDLSELARLDERSHLRPMITSTRDNCLGHTCPRAASCHVNRARQAALEADWVVINHHVLLSDLQLRESGAPALLPSVGVVVLDEAHRLKDLASEMFGPSMDGAMLAEFARDLAARGMRWARGMYPWGHLALNVEQAVARVGSVFRADAAGGAGRGRWLVRSPEGVDAASWLQAAAAVSRTLHQATVALQATEGAAADLRHLLGRAQGFQQTWAALTRQTADDDQGAQVRWVSWSPGQAGTTRWRLSQTPEQVSATFRSLFERRPGEARSWVLTSATLGNDESLTWLTRGVGLEGIAGLQTLRLPSPFDHAGQAALYVPHDLPEPGDDAHAVALADAVWRWAALLGGRTLVLTTSLRAVQRIAAQIDRHRTNGPGDKLELLVQGRLSKPALLDRFRQAEKRSLGAILVASASFWEGVDLPGAALQLLVIDKLPFAPPDDPWLAAQVRQSEANGQSAFETVFLPEAAMALKQGVGRLIRSETDRGVVVIADRRLLTRSYGQALLNSLPAMRQLLDEVQLAQALEALVATRASTRDHPRA